MSEPKKKAKMLHTTKLFGGQKTAEEIYAEIAIGKKCMGCDRPGIMKIATLVSYNDLAKRRPDIVGFIMAAREAGAQPPIIKTKYGPMICVGEAAACRSCTPAAERAASEGERKWSKMGITVHMEFKRGPTPDVSIHQVPAGPTID